MGKDVIRDQVLDLLAKDDFPLKAREISDILSIKMRTINATLANMVKDGTIEHDKRNPNSPFDYFLPRKKSQTGINGYRDLTKIQGVTQKNGAFYKNGLRVTVQELLR